MRYGQGVECFRSLDIPLTENCRCSNPSRMLRSRLAVAIPLPPFFLGSSQQLMQPPQMASPPARLPQPMNHRTGRPTQHPFLIPGLALEEAVGQQALQVGCLPQDSTLETSQCKDCPSISSHPHLLIFCFASSSANTWDQSIVTQMRTSP